MRQNDLVGVTAPDLLADAAASDDGRIPRVETLTKRIAETQLTQREREWFEARG